MKSTAILFLGLISITSAFGADFGTNPGSYFKEGGRFNCSESKKCVVPRVDDIQEMEVDFNKESDPRVNHLISLEDKANAYVESYLNIAQEVSQRIGENNYSNFYQDIAFSLNKVIEVQNFAQAKLYVSENSPVVETLKDLSGFIGSWKDKIENQPTEELKKGLRLLMQKEYKEKILGDEFQSAFINLEKLKNSFFSKEDEAKQLADWFNQNYSLVNYLNRSNCSDELTPSLDKIIGKLTLRPNDIPDAGNLSRKKDEKYIEYILNGKSNDEALKINCEKAKIFRSLKPKFKKDEHRLTIKFKKSRGKFKVSKTSEVRKALNKASR